MGKIKKILENELVGGTQATDVYPVTSTKAVYDENNERLDKILGGLGDKIGILENAGYLYAGVATTTADPGTPKAKVFYIANGRGTYTNFDSLEVTEDEVVILYYDTEWHKDATGIASQDKLTELESEVGLLGIEQGEESVAEVGVDGQYVDFASGGGLGNFAPYAISKAIEVKRFDKIIVKAGANDLISVISKVVQPNGHKALVQGNVSDAKAEYSWIADEDCEIVISYLKSIGAEYSISYSLLGRVTAEEFKTNEKKIEEINILASKVPSIDLKASNKVFVYGAIQNTDLPDFAKSIILNAVKSLRIEGFAKNQQLVATRIRYVAATTEYNTFSMQISVVEGTELNDVCNFIVLIYPDEERGVKTYYATNVTHKDCYGAELVVDTRYFDNNLFDMPYVSLEDYTYNKYGISSECLYDEDYVSAVTPFAPKRVSRAIRSAVIANLDTTRNYRLKTLSYDSSSGLLTVGFCTDENINILGMLFQKTINTEDANGVRNITFDDNKTILTLDFNVLNSVHRYFLSAPSLDEAYDVVLIPSTPCISISAGEELSLTYNGEPMRLLDCGKVSGLFYLGCGRKIFTTEHIVKSAYTDADKSLTLLYEFEDTVTRDQTVYERVECINGIRELNTGKVLVNVAIQTSNNEAFENLNTGDVNSLDQYGKYYMWDGTSMRFLFEGTYGGALLSGGWVKRGGACYMIWDFSEWENYIFLSERGAQGMSGRAWMSNDYGETWYLIFNAYPDTNWIYKNPPYPFRNPSGFDAEHGDFDSTEANGRKFFHIHGIAYDHWRNQVLIVSGDATWVKGSYTAVWVWKNPQNFELWPEQTYEGGYSGTETYPIGGTKADNPVKMIKANWRRVGLHSEETGLEGNGQFVGIIPFKDVIAFTTDNNLKGGNGIVINRYPDNIVSENFIVAYPLSPDSEGNTLTHCGGGYLMLGNLCLSVIHRENNMNIPAGTDRGAAILASYDGIKWKRVYKDDTIDSDKNTEIMWGATIIGKASELWLRYKGFRVEDNKIRKMQLL